MEILYEDKDILAVNKPAGLVVHGDGKSYEPSVAGWVLEKYPETKDVGEPLRLRSGQADEKIINRPGIVHRLDRDTSGVLLIAKSQKAFEHLKNQFKNRSINKIYHAFVYGNMKDDEGTINRPIGRSNKDFRLWSAQRGARGDLREAVTDYKVLKRGKDVTFVEVMPKTGRTHQIRAHFKAINYPVIADPLYAPKREPILGFNRLALHAMSLEFENLEGKKVKVEAPYPEDFKNAIKLLK